MNEIQSKWIFKNLVIWLHDNPMINTSDVQLYFFFFFYAYSLNLNLLNAKLSFYSSVFVTCKTVYVIFDLYSLYLFFFCFWPIYKKRWIHVNIIYMIVVIYLFVVGLISFISSNKNRLWFFWTLNWFIYCQNQMIIKRMPIVVNYLLCILKYFFLFQNIYYWFMVSY